MPALYTNNARSTLAAAINSSVTSFSLATGGGALFPSVSGGADYFYATLIDANNIPEIIKVTSRTIDVLTVERGQDGTSPRSFAIGATIFIGTVKALLDELAKRDGANATGTWPIGISGTAAGNVVRTGGATGAAVLPAGTTLEQPPSPQFGWTRANNVRNIIEWWNGTSWVDVGGSDASDYKQSCRVATTANIATLAGGAPNTLDGVTLVANDRILVKDQTTASQNGIYVVTTLGTGANGNWTRAPDADATGKVNSGMMVSVDEGTASATTLWQLTTANPITLGTTALTFDRRDGFIPQNSQSAAYTLVASDAFKHLLHPSADTTARTWTIPANATVPYRIGTAITFVNQNGAGVITIAITTDTMRLAGAGSTGNRTLAANGIATAIKITATEWIISGSGLT